MARCRSYLALVSWAAFVAAADVVYVTDLDIYTSLAPCVQSPISQVVFALTYDRCQPGVTQLQSCVCSADNNFASISATVSSNIDNYCGNTATDDQASAATVLSAYCNQDSDVAFAPPTVTVSEYITDIEQIQDLAPCAATVLSNVVQSMTNNRCPDPAELLATCACEKDQNSLWASKQIDSSVKFWCSSQTQHIASAQAIFAGYCGLLDGTSSFPEPTNPPGDIHYYITDIDAYASLAPCAQSQLSYEIQSQSYYLCPPGPEALASCVCLDSQMTRYISSLASSQISYFCASTATEELTSLLSVYDLYCSAAKGETTLSDVTTSETSPAHTGNNNGGGDPAQTGATTSSATSTGRPNSGGSSSSSGSNSNSNGSSSHKKSNTSTIAGAVIGAVLGVLAVAFGIFLTWFRKRRANNAAAASPPPATDGEMTEPTPPLRPSAGPTPSPGQEKVAPIVTSSPPYQPVHEAPGHGQNDPLPQEMLAPGGYDYQHAYEAPGHGQNAPPPQELSGLGWQSGPAPQTYEMDGHRQL